MSDKRRQRDAETGTPEQRKALREAMRNPVSVRYSIREDHYAEIRRTIPQR